MPGGCRSRLVRQMVVACGTRWWLGYHGRRAWLDPEMQGAPSICRLHRATGLLQYWIRPERNVLHGSYASHTPDLISHFDGRGTKDTNCTHR
jgi:hypothetical protein